MADMVAGHADSLQGPAQRPFAINPDDNAPLTYVTKGMYVGFGGDVTLRGVDSEADVTYRNLPDASYIAVRARYVRATGTTASAMIGEA